jgi:6-pyruvoyltetrahydropterin/6-carboxytetrahydropterin synthase
MRGTFTVRVEARFESAHYLRSYRGTAEPLHGHSYKVEAELGVAGGGVDHEAISIDFIAAEEALARLARRFHYGCINDIEPFTEMNPTAENLAAWFAEELGRELAGEKAAVRSLTLWEGPLHSVVYLVEEG